MKQEDQKRVLAFLRKVDQLRKDEQALEKAVKAREPGTVRQKQTDIMLGRMHIDRELPHMIIICTWHQLDLFEEKI